jgi:hypothetical protein
MVSPELYSTFALNQRIKPEALSAAISKTCPTVSNEEFMKALRSQLGETDSTVKIEATPESKTKKEKKEEERLAILEAKRARENWNRANQIDPHKRSF